MHSPHWDDHQDYSRENGPMNDFANLSEEPTLEGSYAPLSIEWSYETPFKCSYVPPPPPEEVQSLEDVLSEFF